MTAQLIHRPSHHPGDNRRSRLLRAFFYLWALPTSSLGLILLLPVILTGGRAKIVDGVLEIHGPLLRFILRRCTLLKGGACAMTLGHVVIALDEFTLDATRAHERAHVRQAERWGPLFIPAYLIGSLLALMRGKRPYLDNPFEREAYDRIPPGA